MAGAAGRHVVRDRRPGLESASRRGLRPGRIRRLGDVGPAIALAALALGAILLLEAVLGRGVIFWPVFLGLLGLAILWRQADEAQRERWLDSTGRINASRMLVGSGGWAAWARLAAGIGLLLTAFVLFALRGGSFRMAGDVLVAALLTLAGLGLVVGPWVFRLTADLTAERAERVRTQERADLAAHLHDSVLQTLALIQKNSGDAATVARLARSQERDLRSWLYAGESTDESTLASALRGAAAAVEDAHGVTVDVVAVGDCAFSEALRPVVNATREAVQNAARHAGTGRVDVYAEVGDAAVDVFVRDRGPRLRPRRRAGGPVRRARTASSTAWSGTAAPPRSAPRPARAPRCAAPPTSRGRRSPMADPIRVLVVDDHAIYGPGRRPRDGPGRRTRRAARRASWTSSPRRPTLDEAVARIGETRPAVVLLDVHLPGGGGVEVMRKIASTPALAGSPTRFLALSVSDAAEDVIGTIRGGARGYVTKTITGPDVAAIRRVNDGRAMQTSSSFTRRIAATKLRGR